MKILVTGGAGFIGSNVVDLYVREGHEVVVVDDLSSGKEENLNPKARFYRCDIRSAEMKKILETERPDVVNHHAAQISVPASVEDPVFDLDINVRGFLNVIEAARTAGVRKVIFISSGGAIYGEAEEYPTGEDYRPKPLSPYAITKSVAEDYLFFYNHTYGLDYTVLRYSNIYGPRQIPHGEAGVVAIFMDRLIQRRPCTVYRFPEEPRGMLRDYCYVGDVARANLAAIERGSLGAFNIATGIATHTLDLFNTIYDELKKRVPDLPPSLGEPDTGPARPGDIKRSCLKIERASEGLGWSPEVPLEEGIRRTLSWRLGA